MAKKKIFIPMMEAGAGHRMAALALEHAIEELYPGQFEIRISDFAKEIGALRNDKSMKGAWDLALKRKWWGILIYSTGEIFHPITRIFVPVFLRDFVKKGCAFLREYKPDVVLSTQFFTTTVCAIAKKKYDLPFKVIGCVTDPYDGFSFWSEKKADYLIAASDISKQRLIRHGVKEEKIVRFDFPIEKKFFNITRSKEEIQKEYNIDPAKITIAASAGGAGIGKVNKYIEEIYKRGLEVNLIMVCGKNEKAKIELDNLKKDVPSKTNLIPLGFVNNMNEILFISDIAIGKAGPASILEALMMEKPIIITNWVTFHEKRNLDFVLENHAGWYAPNAKKFFKVLDEALDKNILDRYRENAKKLNLKTGVDEIARFVVDNIE